MVGRLVGGSLVALVALSACSNPDDDFLGGAGPVVGWVDAAERTRPSTTTTTTLPPVGSIDQVTWTNDDLAVGPIGATPSEVAAAVLAAAEGTDSYVQAARRDIAATLPGVDIPSLVPSDVRHVTSQLVFDRTSNRLSTDPATAFGFWLVVPYTQSRSVGQRAVLLVSVELAPASDLADPESACGRFEGRGRCTVTNVGGVPAWWISENNAETLVWYAEPHRYELSMRLARTPELMVLMAESMVPLAGLPAGLTAPTG